MILITAIVNTNLLSRGGVAKRGSKQNGLTEEIFLPQIPLPIHLLMVFL